MTKRITVVTCGGTALFELNDRLEKGWDILHHHTDADAYTTWTLVKKEAEKSKKTNKKRKAVK